MQRERTLEKMISSTSNCEIFKLILKDYVVLFPQFNHMDEKTIVFEMKREQIFNVFFSILNILRLNFEEKFCYIKFDFRTLLQRSACHILII